MKYFIYSFSIVILCFSTQNVYTADSFPNKLSYSIDRGFYKQKFDVELTIDTVGATIKYTLDGSDPSTSSTAKTANAPVTITIDPEDVKEKINAEATRQAWFSEITGERQEAGGRAGGATAAA